MEKRYIIATLIIVGLVALSWIPVKTLRVENTPAENPQYIRRIYKTHTVSQTFEIVTDEQDRVLAQPSLPLTAEDRWIPITLEPPLEPGKHTLTFRNESVEDTEDALLIRFQILSDRYTEGNMQVDGNDSYGDIGFRLYEWVPAWRTTLIWGQITDKAAYRGLIRGGVSLILAALAWSVIQFALKKKTKRTLWLSITLLTIALIAVCVRLPYLSLIESVFGGDAFNYLSKADAMVQGSDPFAADPRKGPLFSLLLIPAFFLPDPLTWSRLVGIAAAAAAAGILPLLARKLGASWVVAISSGFLLTINQDFIWESPNGLANTLYVALIVASIWAYLKSKEAPWQWILAVLLGLTFLTRYEGVLLSAALLPALWVRQKLRWQRGVKLVAVTLMFMAIPQISLIWSGSSGIRTGSDLVHDEGLSIVFSKAELTNNMYELRYLINSAWITPEDRTNVMWALPLGMLLGIAIYLIHRFGPRVYQYGAPWISVILLLTISLLLFTKSSAAREVFIAIPWVCIGVGIIWSCTKKSFDATAITIFILLHTIAITLILPKTRYYLFLMPFFALYLAWGLHTLLVWKTSKLSRAIACLGIFIMGIFLYTDGTKGLKEIELEKYNARSATTTVMLEAMRDLRLKPGNVAIRTGPEAPVLLYLPSSRRYFFADGEGDIGSAELAWLKMHNIRYLVERPDESTWRSVKSHPALFEHLHTYKTIYGEPQVNVYGVHTSKLRAVEN
jgi:hypothetical protein